MYCNLNPLFVILKCSIETLGHMVYNKRWWVLSFKEKENGKRVSFVEKGERRMEEKRGCCSSLIDVAASVAVVRVCLDISVNVIVRSIIFIIIKPGDLVKASFCMDVWICATAIQLKKVEEEWRKTKSSSISFLKVITNDIVCIYIHNSEPTLGITHR